MKKISQKEFERRIEYRFPDESFEILYYESVGKPGIIKCKNCNQEINVKVINNFLASSKTYGCKNCHGLHHAREQKLQQLKELYNILNIEVKDTHKYYTIECKWCGHVRCSTLNNLSRNLKCGCETGCKRNRTAQEFIDELNQYQNNEFELVSEYKNQIEKVLLKHKKCGFIWKVRPGDVIHGRSYCPRCGRYDSKASRFINSLLQNSGLVYCKEHPLNNSLQKFDYYIENENLKIAIEYNGMQHYKETTFFKTTLEEQQDRDARKKQYCKDNNIELIIIPYTMTFKEIEIIIKKIINRFNDYPKREQNISD